MVLRKPYKFLIKHFRLIHLILAFLSGYLITKTSNLMGFFNDYLNNSETLVGTGTSNEYFSALMIVSASIVLIGSIIILVLMKIKDKPIIFYIINTIAYLLIVIVYFYDKSIIGSLELKVLDIRTIKLASDLTLICFMVQIFSTIILGIRGIGFNLKKFDFDQDSFEISDKDNEEFEFDLNIDSNEYKRNLNRTLRDLRYTYQENKFYINIIMLILIIIIGILIYLNFGVYHKVYKQNEVINASDISFTINNSYLTNNNYKNNQITNNYLLVAKIKLKKNTTTKKQFVKERVLLHIGKVLYNPTEKYKEQLIDIGTTYKKQNLTNEFNEYLLVFEIPKKYISKKMILSYSDPYTGNYNIKLSPKKFDEKQKIVTSKLNEEMKIDNKLINKTKIKITNFEIADKIKANYYFCSSFSCSNNSYEYIIPELDNYVSSVLKINGNIEFDNVSYSNLKDISDFIEIFGSIKYKINGQEKEMNTSIKKLNPTKSNIDNTYYFQIYREIKTASNISLVFTIRNTRYEYILR